MECKLENIKIYYEIYGKGRPILMIHGFAPDHRLMKGCMEPIFENREDYQRIYFDLPGMGKTTAPRSLENSDQILDIVLEFIDRIIPNENFIIASESYGCYLARGILLNRSNLIDGVLFICPLIIPLPEKRDLPKKINVIMKDTKFISSLNPLDAIELEDSLVIQNKDIWERFREEVLSGLKIVDQEFMNRVFPANYKFSFKVDHLLQSYDKPTLFLLGRQDTTVGYRDAWKLIENYPRATFTILDQAGHNLQIEKTELFNSLVYDWLARVEYNISYTNKN
ncbi:MAG: alpha/beta fold hydrolase [Candidatus Odinarchaeota archaeon]